MPDESRTDTTGTTSVGSGVTAIGKDAMRIGNYALRMENGRPVTLGKGGFGKTYLGTHVFLHKKAVIKVIHDIFSEDETIKERFFNEARALADLDHAHIARILDFGEDDNRLYYAMEYGDLGDLEKYILEKGPHTTAHVLDLALQAAEALGYTHGKGLLHRDIKPSNFVMCSKEGAPDGKVLKVIDFGLVKRLGGEANLNLTQTGQALISLCYASPEQIQGGTLDVRSDIFSLGLTLWFMLGGRPLFVGQQPTTVALERARPGASYRPRLPAELNPGVRELLARMVDFDAANRPQTMGEVAELIRACQQNLDGVEVITPPAPVLQPLETHFTIRQKIEGFRTPTYEAMDLVSQMPACLRWFGETGQGDSDSNWAPIEKLIAQINDASPPYFLRPRRLIHFEDCTVIDEECGGDLTIKALAAVSKGLTLAEAMPLLVQLAQAIDSLPTFDGLEASLQPGHLFIQFPLSSWTQMDKKNPLSMPVSSWPAFLLRVQPDYTVGGTGEDDSLNSGVTVNLGMDDIVARAPVPRFGATLYYLLAACPPRSVGRAASGNYVRLPALSEAGNDLLRMTLTGLSEHQTCGELLKALAAGENATLPQVSFPADLDTVKDYRALIPASLGGATSRHFTSGTGTGQVILKPVPPVTQTTGQQQLQPPPLPPSQPPLPPAVTLSGTSSAGGATAVTQVFEPAAPAAEKKVTVRPPPLDPRRPAPMVSAMPTQAAPALPTQVAPALPTQVAPAVLPPTAPPQQRFVQSGDTAPYSPVPPLPVPGQPPVFRSSVDGGRKTGGMVMMLVIALLLGSLAAGGYWYVQSQKKRTPEDTALEEQQQKDEARRREEAESIRKKEQKEKDRLAQERLDQERIAKERADKELADAKAKALAKEKEEAAKIAMINSSPFKLLVSGEHNAPGASILLDGKPLAEYNGSLPHDTRFPVKLQVTSAGFVTHDRDLRPTAGERSLAFEVPVLARNTGTVQVPVPKGGSDYPTVQLAWVGPLAEELGAPEPLQKLEAKLPGANSFTAGAATISNVPSGRYIPWLIGGRPHLEDRALQQVVSVRSDGIASVSDMPETLAGTYVCEFDFPVRGQRGHADGKIHVIRRIKIEPGLRGGSGSETMQSGPVGMVVNKGTPKEKVLVFPFTDIFSLTNLKYDAAEGLTGVMNPESNPDGTVINFAIAGPQVSFLVPKHPLQVEKVSHSVP